MANGKPVWLRRFECGVCRFYVYICRDCDKGHRYCSVRCRRTARGRPVARGSVRTDAERDFTVKVDASGLDAGTTYYYQFETAGIRSPLGRTRTLPVGPTERVRLAFTSCSDIATGYFNAYARIAEREDLDAVLHLGDYLYEYEDRGSISGRAPEPAREIVTLRDYRRRHAQYKRDPDLRAAHRWHPFIAVWDDHEIANDAWRDGARNHDASNGSWEARREAATRAYLEWMPVRESGCWLDVPGWSREHPRTRAARLDLQSRPLHSFVVAGVRHRLALRADPLRDHGIESRTAV